LFGSRARGDAGPGSDIDIMVELDPAEAPRRLPALLEGRHDIAVETVAQQHQLTQRYE